MTADSRSAAAWPAFLAAMSLAGCSASGPPRAPPAYPSPADYSVEATPASLPPDGGIGQTVAIGAAPNAAWWEAYGSPELDALVAEALAHSPSLQAARANLTAAHEQLRETIGDNLFPHVDAGFDPSRQRALGLPILTRQTFLYDVFAAEVQVGWTIDFFGASLLADRSLGEQVHGQAFEFEATRRALAANLVLAVINAASLEAQIDSVSQWVGFAESRAGQTRERHELGSASRFEMLTDAEAAAEAARALPPLRRQLLAVRHAEAVLLGRTPDRAPPPLPLESLRPPDPLPLAVPSELLHQRPDIRAAEAAVRASADAAGAATAALYPSLTLSADYGRGGFDWSTFASPAGALWGVGAGLTQPLFHGGALRARARRYQAVYDAAVAQYRQTVLTAFQSVADSLVALQEDAASLDAARRSSEALEGMQADLEQRFAAGSVPLSQLLAVREQYQDARARYAVARAARLADSAALLDAMGETGRPIAP